MLKIKQVAEKLGIHPLTLRKWIQAGEGPEHIRTPGDLILIREEDLEHWIESRKPAIERNKEE